MPSSAEHSCLSRQLDDLSVPKSVNKKLQAYEITLASVRSLFDVHIQNFPSMANILSSDASLISNKELESAVVKIQN